MDAEISQMDESTVPGQLERSYWIINQARSTLDRLIERPTTHTAHELRKIYNLSKRARVIPENEDVYVISNVSIYNNGLKIENASIGIPHNELCKMVFKCIDCYPTEPK